jgi:exonuclease SbcC
LITLADLRLQVIAIQREADLSTSATSQQDEAILAGIHRKANSDLQGWQRDFGSAFSSLSERITKLVPDAVLPQNNPLALHRDPLDLLRVRKQRATQDARREVEVAAELVVARKNLATIDTEIGRIAVNSGNLAAALAELSSFITSDSCPVCDRDFAEQGRGSLSEHVSHKVRFLSGSADRLLGLSKNRGDQQILIERLEREAAELNSRKLDPRTIAALEREAADIDALVLELNQRADAAREGTRLATAETAARRALAERQSRNLARTATMATLIELANAIDHSAPEGIATPQSVITQLLAALDEQTEALNRRVSARRRAGEALERARAEIARRQALDMLIRERHGCV